MKPEETIRILGVESVLGLLRDIALNVFTECGGVVKHPKLRREHARTLGRLPP